MNRHEAFLDAVRNMRALAASLEALAILLEDAGREDIASAPAPEPPLEAVSETAVSLNLAEVRAILGAKSANGYAEQIRGLIRKYGGKLLSEVDPKDYAALLRDAEVYPSAT